MRWAILLTGFWMIVAPTVQAADIAGLTNSFAGQFDSRVQWDVEDRANIPERERHPWTTIIHKSVSLPDLGADVFYVEEYRDGKPAKVVRQRLVSFAAEGDQIRMRQYAFKTPTAVLHAHKEPARLAGLTRDQLIPLTGCDVLWRYDSESFWGGQIPGKSCVVTGGGRARYVQYTVSLTSVLYQRVDRDLYADDDSLAAGFADELPAVHARVSAVP